MSESSSLVPLKKTYESLKKIQETLIPFLELVNRYYQQQKEINGGGGSLLSKDTDSVQGKKIELFQITEAEAAISLSVGTLRYMAFRLKGQKSDGKNDPLRLELDKIRKTLVELRKLKKKISSSKNDSTSTSSPSPKKKDEKNSTSVTNTVGSSGKKKRKSSEKKNQRNGSPKKSKSK